jgi:hypothetical protein
MLYKDGVRVYLDTSDGIAQKCRRLLKELKEIANSKGIVRFKTLPGMKNPGLFIPLQANVKTPDGAYTIVYAETVQRKGEQLVFSPTTLRWPASGSVDLNRDPELAIFLYGFSTLCYNGKSPNKSNVCWFMVEDMVRESEAKVSVKKIIGKVTAMVLETTDGGGAPLQIVTSYANSKGMRFHDGDNETIIRSKIMDVIESSNLYENFMNALENRDYFKHTELVTQMVEFGLLKVVALTQNKKEKAWRLVNEDGSYGDILCRIPMKVNAKSHILDKLDNEPWLVERMEDMLEEHLDSLVEIPERVVTVGRKRHDFPVEPPVEPQATYTPEEEFDEDPDVDSDEDFDKDIDNETMDLLDALSEDVEEDEDKESEEEEEDEEKDKVSPHPAILPSATPKKVNKPKTKTRAKAKKTTSKKR